MKSAYPAVAVDKFKNEIKDSGLEQAAPALKFLESKSQEIFEDDVNLWNMLSDTVSAIKQYHSKNPIRVRQIQDLKLGLNSCLEEYATSKLDAKKCCQSLYVTIQGIVGQVKADHDRNGGINFYKIHIPIRRSRLETLLSKILHDYSRYREPLEDKSSAQQKQNKT